MKKIKKVLSAVSAIAIAVSAVSSMALTVSAKRYVDTPAFDAANYDYSDAIPGMTSIADIWNDWEVESGEFLYQEWGGIDTCGFEGPRGKLVSPGYCKNEPGYKIEFVLGKARYCHDTMVFDADGKYIFGYAYASFGDGFYPQDGEREDFANITTHLKEEGNESYTNKGNYCTTFINDKSVMRIEVENFNGAVEGTEYIGDYYTVIYSVDANGDDNFVKFATEYYKGSVNGFGGFEVGNNAGENAAYGKLKITPLLESTEPGEEPQEEEKVTVKYSMESEIVEKSFSNWGGVLTEIEDISWNTIYITVNEDITLDNQRLLYMDADTRNNTIYLDAAEGKDVTITAQNLTADDLIFLDSNRAGSGKTYIGTMGGHLTIDDNNNEQQLTTLCKGCSLTLGENLALNTNAKAMVFAWETPTLVFDNFNASGITAPMSSTNTGVCTFKLVGDTIFGQGNVFAANVKDKLDVSEYTGSALNIEVNNPSAGLEIATGSPDKLIYESDSYVLAESDGKILLAAKKAPTAEFENANWESTNDDYTTDGNKLIYKNSDKVFYGYKATITGIAGTYKRAVVEDSKGIEKGSFESTITLDNGGVIFYMITDKDADGAKITLK